ncbi:MAG: LSM domain-containing protein [Thermoplasmata archaeon]|nr:LSM domain-containing protein [Thermoplasmata archaeon]
MDIPPHALLERMLQQKIILQLKDGRVLAGRLLGGDEHMNLVLDEVEEKTHEVTRRLGRVVLRGSNVVSLQAPMGTAAKAA